MQALLNGVGAALQTAVWAVACMGVVLPCSAWGDSADWCMICMCSLTEEQLSQGLLSGVGTALKDALQDGLRLTLSGEGPLPALLCYGFQRCGGPEEGKGAQCSTPAHTSQEVSGRCAWLVKTCTGSPDAARQCPR